MNISQCHDIKNNKKKRLFWGSLGTTSSLSFRGPSLWSDLKQEVWFWAPAFQTDAASPEKIKRKLAGSDSSKAKRTHAVYSREEKG